MKKKGKQTFKRLSVFALALMLSFGVFAACKPPAPEEPPPEEPPAEEELGDPIVFDLDAYKNPYGYASLTVTNRKSVAASKIAEAGNEIEFLDALLDKSKTVIKITADLDMGYDYVIAKLKAAGKTDAEIASKYANETKYTIDSVYRRNPALPKVHPDLKESGIGQLLIQNRSELMIYSETGIAIKHLTTWIRGTNSKPVSNIVIRNLVLTDIWEWDEASFGQYDQNDWDYFTIERASDIWIDHITFGNSYDGTADVKLNCKNITFSWLDMDFPIIESVRRQKQYLDEHIDEYPYYKEIKGVFEGMPEEDFLTYLSSQKKGFNLGNTTDGPGFEEMTVTIHNVNAYNLQDRLPRLRKGDVHMYNVLSDNSDLYEVRRRTGQPITNQAIVSTEDGAVLMENSRFVSVNEPIKTHQESNPDSKYSGKYKVVDSQLISGGVTYFASTPSSVWSSLSSAATVKPFFLRNYEFIPYNYSMVKASELRNVFANNHVGAGIIEGLDWKEIMRSLGTLNPAPADGHKINPAIELPQANVELGTSYTDFEPEVYNFYKPVSDSEYAKFVKGTDYTLDIDKRSIPVNAEGLTTTKGLYYVTYTFTSLKNPDDKCKVMQTVVVFDQNDFSVPCQISNEFNKKINLTYQANLPSGTVYYLLTDDELDLENSHGTIKANGESVVNSTTVRTSVRDIITNDKKYLYAFIDDDSVYGKIQKLQLRLEQEINISSEKEFADMVSQSGLTGVYYKLTKNLDFTGKNDLFKRLQNEDGTYINVDSTNMVFDGQGYTISNLKIEQTDPGASPPPEWTDPRRGLFGRANNSVVKNINFVSCGLTSHKDANNTGFLFELSDNYLEVDNVSMTGLEVRNSKSGYVAAVVGLVNSGTVVLNRISLVDAVITGIKNYNGGLIGGNKTMGITYELSDLHLDNVKLNENSMALQYAGLVVGRYMGKDSIMTLDGLTVYNSKVGASVNAGLVFAKLETGAKFVGANMFFAGNLIKLGDAAASGGFVTGNYNTADDLTPNKLIALKVYVTENNTFTSKSGDFTYADRTRRTEGDEEEREDLCVVEISEINSAAADGAWFTANLSELTDARGWKYLGGKLVLEHPVS